MDENQMNQLINALQKKQNVTTTQNGAKAFKSTTNACVDLFASWGGARGQDLTPAFAYAYAENQDQAIRIALWGRDVREGAGEREQFRNCLKYLAEHDYKTAQKILHKVPELGRWDDLLVLHGTAVWNEVVALIQQGIKETNGLLGKWLPRKGPVAVALTKALGYTPKQYRKTIVGLTKVVEQQMCAQQWDKINYQHVPSIAAKNYTNAFKRHDLQRYNKYKAALVKGEAKINAAAIYPYQVLNSLKTDEQIAEAQWKALPDFVPDGISFLPVIDTSGSMGFWQSNGSPANVAISLGLYLSQRNKSVFKDVFMTFSQRPQLQKVSGTLKSRIQQMNDARWQMNTDIRAVFLTLLAAAKENKVPEKDMPTHILIVSDMQFDGCAKEPNFKEIKQLYKQYGYEMPQLVFWNVAYKGTQPVKANKENATLISGFSPSIMKSILSQKNVTPYEQMLETIMNERYNY